MANGSLDSELNGTVEQIIVTEVAGCTDDGLLPISNIELAIHLYQLHPVAPEPAVVSADEQNELQSSFSRTTVLPSVSLSGLWDSWVVMSLSLWVETKRHIGWCLSEESRTNSSISCLRYVGWDSY